MFYKVVNIVLSMWQPWLNNSSCSGNQVIPSRDNNPSDTTNPTSSNNNDNPSCSNNDICVSSINTESHTSSNAVNNTNIPDVSLNGNESTERNKNIFKPFLNEQCQQLILNVYEGAKQMFINIPV